MLQVALQGVFSNLFSLQLQNFAPGIFTTTGTLGQIQHLNGTPVTFANPAQPGEALSLVAVGLGPTTPPIATGTPAPSSPIAITNTTPSITIDGQNAPVQQSGLQPQSVGRYQVFFTAPNNLSPGSHSLELSIGGIKSNSVTLVTAGQGQPSINSVVNAGNFAGGIAIAPGSIVSIFGLNFGNQDAGGLFPATSFQGLSVKFNGIQSPLFAVVSSSNQVNAFVPNELAGFGSANVQVSSPSGASSVFAVQLAPSSPGFFRIPDPSKSISNNAAALFANSAWLVVPSSLASALQIPQNCSTSSINPASICGQAARVGDFLQIFTTGLGKATVRGNPNGNTLPTGTAAPATGPLYETIDTPVVMLGGVPVQVTFSGLAPGFAGLYQINFQVPSGVVPGSQVPLTVTTSNGLSDNATLAIQP